jgi:hypothetical protein
MLHNFSVASSWTCHWLALVTIQNLSHSIKGLGPTGNFSSNGLELDAHQHHEQLNLSLYCSKRCYISGHDHSFLWPALTCVKFSVFLRMLNIGEFDCIGSSFVYLAHRLPRSELLELFQRDAITAPMTEVQSLHAAYNSSFDLKLTKVPTAGSGSLDEMIHHLMERSSRVAEDATINVPLAEAEPDVFPCLLVNVGSVTGFMRIDKDGTIQLIDVLFRTGKAYFGIGKMLTGCQTFGEMIDMASKGNKRKVDQYTDMHSKVDKDDWYSIMLPSIPYLSYGFGEAADSDPGKLSREDVAHAWLSHVAAELACSVQFACHLHGIKRVFFCGGFCSQSFVRHVITAEFANRLLLQKMFTKVDYIDFDFVKAGEFLGALGCAVADLENKRK